MGVEEVGRRLLDARRARGMTQEQAAMQAGMARTTLVSIEKGSRRVGGNELVRLAGLYGVPVSRLVGESALLPDFVTQLRLPERLVHSSPGLAEQIEPARLEFKALCEDYLTLERTAGVSSRRPHVPAYYLEGMSPEAAGEDVASRERSRLGLGDAPIHQLRELLELDAGLRIFSFPVRPSAVAGMYVFTTELGGCVLINHLHPPTRRRWSLAHEYAHYLTQREQGEVTVIGGYARQPWAEQFAEYFSRHMLMPASGVRTRFREIVGAQGDFTVADLVDLAHLYAVSVQTMCHRLEELRSISAGTWDRLSLDQFKPETVCKELSEEPLSARLPARYIALAVRLFDRGELSEGRLARYLRMDRVEARAVVEEMRRVTSIDDDGTPGLVAVRPGNSIGVLRS